MLLMLTRLPIEKELSLQLQEGIQDIVAKYKEEVSSDETLLTLSENDYEEFMAIYSNITTTYKSEFTRLTDDYRKNKQVLERNSRRLANINSKENDELIDNRAVCLSCRCVSVREGHDNEDRHKYRK